MSTEQEVTTFLTQYDEAVHDLTMQTRVLLFKLLPDVQEEVDLPAKILGYGYGRKYAETVCTLILSKKGLKLGFYRAIDLPDPENILEGTGKVHKYVVMNAEAIRSKALKNMLAAAYKAYSERIGN